MSIDIYGLITPGLFHICGHQRAFTVFWDLGTSKAREFIVCNSGSLANGQWSRYRDMIASENQSVFDTNCVSLH